MTLHRFDLDPITLTLDDSVGHIAALTVRDGDRELSPLHRAPWVDDPATAFPEGAAPNVRRLSGDFLCAPFGRNDIEEAPSHGWPANSAWDLLGTQSQNDRLEIRFRLQRRVMGASVEKRITLIAGHPFLYQEHRFSGGTGSVSAAHHVMVHMSGGGDVAYSPKTHAETPPDALEPDPSRGRSLLAYPARTPDLTAFPRADGGTADLTRYPPGSGHEDFLTLVEADGAPLGWTVVSRHAERDHVIVLKRRDTLPVTMLWMSNGGRDYAPWSGRHTGVLGIEDARASPLGHADSIRDNGFTRSGVPTAFDLGEERPVVIRQVIGACAAADGRVSDVEVEDGELLLRSSTGSIRRLPYDSGFLAG